MQGIFRDAGQFEQNLLFQPPDIASLSTTIPCAGEQGIYHADSAASRDFVLSSREFPAASLRREKVNGQCTNDQRSSAALSAGRRPCYP
jgi:hypothetical protein